MPRDAPMTNLAKEAGITLKQIEYWCLQGYIKSRTRGGGYDRVIELGERRIILVMARLVNAGLTPKLASRVARIACDTVEPGKPAGVRINRKDTPRIRIIIEET